MLPPLAARISPNSAIASEGTTPTKGGQGDALLGLPPLWGREGVTLIAPVREQANHGGKRISTEPDLSKTALKSGVDELRIS